YLAGGRAWSSSNAGVAPRGAGPNRRAMESSGQGRLAVRSEPSTPLTETVTGGRWTARGRAVARQLIWRHATSNDQERRYIRPDEIEEVRVGATWSQSPNVAERWRLPGSAWRRSATT